MRKLIAILVLALSLVGGSQASADSGDLSSFGASPDVGVTWE